jgi:gas vesicle protein
MSECCVSIMYFDVVSFLVGVLAGALTGGLAGLLHELESTADLQERVRRITQELQKLSSAHVPDNSHRDDTKFKLNELQRDLHEIQDEIRRLYKRTSR